jgi:hypothetical protein
MKTFFWQKGISRRGFLRGTIAGVCFSLLNPFNRMAKGAPDLVNMLFSVKDIPDYPFYSGGTGNDHVGVDALFRLMGNNGLKFYRSSQETALSGPSGMIASNDVVLIKVNAQWKYRGCTNSDLIRGLIQAILDHPDGFNGEVVIFENGQGRGRLSCDNNFPGENYPDATVHANANDENQSFLYLVNVIFNDPRVSAFLLDPYRTSFIGAIDHSTNGYRTNGNVSYPCFTTARGNRVELKEGIWQGSGYSQTLKLINVPVLKYHDTGGSEITASLKHFYGVVSMADGQQTFRHYVGLGQTCGTMVVSVRTPVLNIIDATWVSFSSIAGYPSATTYRANQILASQDPVALDYWAAKYILYPISNNPRHLPTFSGIDQWLTSACNTINGGLLYNPNGGIMVDKVTKTEGEMLTHDLSLSPWIPIPGQTASTPALDWNPVAPKMQIVVRGGGDTIWAGTFKSRGVFEVGSWVQIPGAILSAPALAWNPVAQKMQIVVRGVGDTIWAGTFNSSGVFEVGSWVQIPGAILSAPALAWNQGANKMQIVVHGGGNTIWAATFDSNGGFNNDWTPIPGSTPATPALAGNATTNKLHIVVRGMDDGLWTASFGSNGTFDNNWSRIPGTTPSAPALAWNLTDKFHIIVRGGGGSIWSGTFISSGAFNNSWTPISGVILSAPALAWNDIAQKMQIVVRGRGDTMWSALANADGSF